MAGVTVRSLTSGGTARESQGDISQDVPKLQAHNIAAGIGVLSSLDDPSTPSVPQVILHVRYVTPYPQANSPLPSPIKESRYNHLIDTRGNDSRPIIPIVSSAARTSLAALGTLATSLHSR